MSRALLAVAAAALVLVACGDQADGSGGGADAPDETEVGPDGEAHVGQDGESGDGTDVEVREEGADVEVEEGGDPGDVGPDSDLFGPAFDARWHVDEPTEVAVLADAEADLEDLAAAVEAESDVEVVDALGEEALGERMSLEMVYPPDEPGPLALTATAADHDAALELEAIADHEDVDHVFTPDCGVLAGSARRHGADQASAWLDDVGCDQPVVVGADADAAEPWVAAAGVDGDELCTATATSAGAAVGCQPVPEADDPEAGTTTSAGGMVSGVVPADADAVEVAYGDETVTADAVTVSDGAPAAFAAVIPGVPDAPDIAAVDTRVLDADGEVIDEG